MRLAWRFLKLLVGLSLFGVGIWLGLQARLGVGPWDVLHGGVAKHLGTPFGRTSIGVSVVVFVIALLARVRPGIGTVLNVVVIGAVIDLCLGTSWLDGVHNGPLGLRLLTTAAGIASVAVGSALYLGAHLGPGPRDGLMTGLSARFGKPIALVRTCIEVTAVAIGIALGGRAGLGSVAFAVLVGPAVAAALWVAGRRGPLVRPASEP